MIAMSSAVPVSIPRWEWSTVAADLSWLLRRDREPVFGPERRVAETHLLCTHSTHDAVLRDVVLEVRWRKEMRSEGCELWDTVLHASLPFRGEDLERLWGVWELPPRPFQSEYPTIASFMSEAIVPEAAIVPVSLTRATRAGLFQGITCSIETLEVDRVGILQRFSIEHEDPSLIAQSLADLGLDADANINLPQALRAALGLRAPGAGVRTWPKRSNASTW